MKDYIGEDLRVGDDVIFVGYGSGEFSKGRIEMVTKDFVYFNYLLDDGSVSVDGLIQKPNQVLKLK